MHKYPLSFWEIRQIAAMGAVLVKWCQNLLRGYQNDQIRNRRLARDHRHGFSRGAAEVLAGYGFKPYVINRSSPTPRPHHLPGQGLHRRLEGIPGHLKYKKNTSLRGPQARTPGWLLLPFGQFTFWQSPGSSGCPIGATFYPRDCHTSVRTGSQ